MRTKLTEPYTIAYETVDSVDHVFLKVHTDRGIIGYGCSSPDPFVTGETSKSVLSACQSVIVNELLDRNPLKITRLLSGLKPYLEGQPSALALVDIALHDILGKVAGLPLFCLLGGFRDSVKTSITIGISDARETVVDALRSVRRGFRALKVKGGLDVHEDIDRILRVREAVGKGIEIRFDANQGYTVEEALLFFRETKKAGIELFEQPTPKERIGQLGNITRRVDIPIMADESLVNLRDAFKLARDDLVDMVNIKIMKVGGIFEALQVNAVARAGNLETMIGCMDEPALGIAAGLHVALSRPNVMYADLDGHLDLEDDPTSGAVRLRKGRLYPSKKAGLGSCYRE